MSQPPHTYTHTHNAILYTYAIVVDFVLYQPTKVYIADPDLILPRGELEFTTLDPTLK